MSRGCRSSDSRRRRQHAAEIKDWFRAASQALTTQLLERLGYRFGSGREHVDFPAPRRWSNTIMLIITLVDAAAADIIVSISTLATI